MKIVACIQARMGSKRLPGKVVMDLNGLTPIEHIYRRLLSCKQLDGVVVSAGEENKEPILELSAKYSMRVWWGSEDDLIERHLGAGEVMSSADAIVRITADEPLIDPNVVGIVVSEYVSNYPKYDFVCNWSPRTWPNGQDVDLISMRLLAELDRTPECPREDYSTWVTKNKPFLNVSRGCGREGVAADKHNLCLDTPEDHAKLSKILARIGNDRWKWTDAVYAMEGK